MTDAQAVILLEIIVQMLAMDDGLPEDSVIWGIAGAIFHPFSNDIQKPEI